MYNWNSYKDFFEKLNEQEYVILRNHEKLMEELSAGGDIDILCAAKEHIVEQIYAFPRASRDKIYNYWVMIENKRVPIDIREIGDGYYDEEWEKNMLDNRIKTADYFIMDEENYKYSLLYHAIMHKSVIAKKYIGMLENMFGMRIDNDNDTNKLLSDYMNKNRYSISRPLDIGVSFNNDNRVRLQEMLRL